MAVDVRLTGTFRVLAGAAPHTEQVIGSPKARRLVALLAAHRGQVLTADRLAEALWDDHAPQHPTRNVATLVSRLRSQLGADVIEGDHRGYRLGAARVDVAEAARLVGEAGRRLDAGTPALAGTAAARAMEVLGTGQALSGEPDGAWVTALRAEVAALLRTARHHGASAALRTGRPGVAVDLAGAAVADDRFDEAAHRLLMRAHQMLGEPALALATYQRLVVALRDELGVEPAPQTRRTHLAVLREERHTDRPAPPGPDRRGLQGAPRVVGRTDELARTTAAWEAAGRGRPSVVLLVGEAGIGKTTLAEAAAATAEATGGRAVVARCYAAERSLFLQPFAEALGQVLGALPADAVRRLAGARAAPLAELLPDLADALGGPEPGRSSPEAERRRAFEAVTHVLTTLAGERPLLLVLDDLHNTGRAGVELLHYLARRARPARLLAVATVRVEEGADVLAALSDVATRIDVGPLPESAVAELAAAAGRADLAADIHARTRGHALFVVETLRRPAAAGIPETLQAAVLARLHRAGPELEELLRAGAVLGAAVDPALVAGLLDLSPAEALRRCVRAVDTRLLVTAGRTYEFANDLVQEVLYATTPHPVREAHHRRAADLLTATPEAVAAHATAAGDWPRAARAWLLAGEQARARSAADAVVLLGRALDAARRAADPELAGRAHVARGRAREALQDFGAAADDHRAALAAAREAGDQRLAMTALRELGGDAVVGAGQPATDCLAPLQAGLRIAAALGDRGAEADAAARLAVLATHRLAFAEALAQGRRAAAAGRAAGADEALVTGLDGLKSATACLGEVRELSAVVEELEPLARRTGDLLRLHWVVFEGAFVAVGAGDWTTAQDRIDEALSLNARSGYAAHEIWMRAHLGWVARLRGRHDEALEHGRRALALGVRTGHPWWLPAALTLLAGTLLQCGGVAERTEAVALLGEAADRTRQDGLQAHRLRCLAPLAEATGDPAVLAEADALLRGIEAPPGGAWITGMDAYTAVARAWLRAGQPQRARDAVAPLRVAAQRTGWVPALAAAALEDGRAAALLGDGATARTLLHQAGELGRQHGMPQPARAAEEALAAAAVAGGG
jgi:DNA-binding SARP family transcriptional activator/tetratricopeptide (TPR) repeat protein